jgi:FSR family fosmidomycin resistance protein-like MFS transporter
VNAPGRIAAPVAAGSLAVVVAASGGHLLNDLVQSVMVASYPEFRSALGLSFAQLGLITLAFQVTASLLQPLIGMSTDRRPRPYSLVAGAVCTLAGLVVLSLADGMPLLMAGSCLVGLGSSVFHPEASRVARLASGGRYGAAQSLFQVGGNVGSAIGPLCAAWIVIPRGHAALLWFAVLPLLAMTMLAPVGRWYRAHLAERQRSPQPGHAAVAPLPRSRTVLALAVLSVLLFSKFVYLASLGNFYLFYLMDHFSLSQNDAQIRLFVLLAANAAGTILGGPIGDRIGHRRVIWVSILGVAPFTLLLPHVGLAATTALTVAIGLILSSAFSAMLVYAQTLLPGRVGLVSGLFFGLAFGLAGIAAAALGRVADEVGLEAVYRACAFLPLLGVAAVLLPRIDERR